MDKIWWVIAGIVGAIALIVGVLSLGGSGGTVDPTADVVVEEGPAPPEDPSLADISAAEVRRQEGRLVFVAESVASLPAELADGSLEFRWDLSEDGRDTWIVLATVNVGLSSGVTSQRTGYSSSTIDGSLPGRVSIEGTVLRVTLRAADIDGFPDSFRWTLTTTLDGDRTDAGSAIASDRMPDVGSVEVDAG